MRIFNTVQELWGYCLFCPLCQEPSRTLTLSVGPDDQFQISQNIPYEKIGSQLKLYCSFRVKKEKASATFDIDCNTNQYMLQTGGQEALTKQAEEAYFYLSIDASCKKCLQSYVNTADLDFDFISKKIGNIRMEREGYSLGDYHLRQHHDENITRVFRIYSQSEIDKGSVVYRRDSDIKLPLFKIDFTDLPKAINKLKTLILFS